MAYEQSQKYPTCLTVTIQQFKLNFVNTYLHAFSMQTENVRTQIMDAYA